VYAFSPEHDTTPAGVPERDSGPRHYALVAVEGLDGSGKTTLVRGLAADLSGRQSVHVARPARNSIHIFREMAGDDGIGPVMYQDHVPPGFRHSLYILETAVQFRYLDDYYAAHDLVIFDRWRHTWSVYCGEPAEHTAWLDLVASMIPVPDVLFYLRVDPRIAAARLIARGDRWARVYQPRSLVAKLAALHERYEAELAGTGAVVLDGMASEQEIRRAARRAVTALTTAPAGGPGAARAQSRAS
jgi:thymidylate kinase